VNSVRGKLIVLLSGFAAFAVLAAGATIYAVQWQLDGAVRNFERATGMALEVERLQLSLREQLYHLRRVVAGSTEAVKPYFGTRDEFLTKLRQTVRFSIDSADGSDLLDLATAFEQASDRCLALMQASDLDRANNVLTVTLEGDLVPKLESRLLRARAEIDESRHRSTWNLGAASTEVLALTFAVAISAAGLVVIGAMLIRRWLIAPILELREAARRFGRGDFDYRVRLQSRDELGTLGTALNDMAASVSNAQRDLQISETKHRALFRNLRDAVVICAADGRVVECHDSDQRSLGVDPESAVGHRILEVWPEWADASADWAATISAVIDGGKRWRAVGVPIRRPDGETSVDFVAYRVEYGQAGSVGQVERRETCRSVGQIERSETCRPISYAAIVVRDVTERQRLQRKLWRAETMEALGTLAGGLAHDFNNLLSNITETLSELAAEFADSRQAERLQGALRACRHASALSRRLLSFATSAHGEPQVFPIGETTELIVGSIDPSFFEGITLRKQLDCQASVRMDRDQFTEVVMNLLRNAREAMPEGGELAIRVEPTVARDPERGAMDKA